MTKYYRVRTQEQWDWLKNKLEIEDDLHVSDFPMTLLYGDVFCGIYRYHDDPEPLIEVSQMMEESRMKDYVTIETKDIEKIIDGDDDQVFIDQGDGRFTYAFVNNQELVKLKFPKSLFYPKVCMSVAEKKEFDELKSDWQVLICAFDAINEIDYPRWFSRLNDYPDDNDEHQLDFARAWADPSLIEVIPEDKYWVKCYPTDDCYFYKYEGKILAGVPRVHLERFQFTTDEIVEYHLDGTENIFEKVEVSE